MAVWFLAQAVADLFERVAEALRGGGGSAISPIPPGPSNPPIPPTPLPPGGGGSTTPIPEPPVVTQPPSNLPPPVVILPSNPLPTPTTPPENCPPLSLADRLAIYGLQNRSQSVPSPIGSTLLPEVLGPDDMILTQATGTPIEPSDYFRFRAISTSQAVEVTFYGRIQLRNKQIVPFSAKLTTTTAGTLYEATMQGADGYLLGAAASVPINSISVGTVNAIGEIGRLQGNTFVPHTLLFSGQLDDLTPLTDSSGSIVQPVSGGSFISTNPGGSGTELTTTVTPSQGKQARTTLVFCSFTNSAAAGDRAFVIRFKVGGNTIWRNTAGAVNTASQLGIVQGTMGGNVTSVATAATSSGDLMQLHLPESLYFNTAYVVSVLYDTAQAGDALSNLFVAYEES